ncbi:MAG: sugar ABC transporter permease, partial [Deltaproteobacteria bacterium]|nr:sugar ABC transporter permease [Deltaproteobacteria bacterium]
MGEDRSFRELLRGYSFIAPLAACLLAFVFAPVVGTCVDSLYRDVTFLPRSFIGLGNYASLASDPAFLQSLRFTVLFVLASVPLELVLGLAFALLLHRPSPARGALRACVLILWAVPAAVSGKVFELIFNFQYGSANYLLQRIGLADGPVNWLGTAGGAFFAIVAGDVWKTAPFVAILFLAGLSAIPEDLYRQAA